MADRLACAALAISIALGLGCTAPIVVRPPLSLIRPDRPAIVDENRRLTDEGILWIGELVRSYRENCVAISVLRGEDVKQCDRGLERD